MPVTNLERLISGFRADPKNKFGSGTGVETRPTHFDRQQVANYLQSLATAREKYGVQHPDPVTLTNMLLKEGRADFGCDFNPPTPREKQLIRKMRGDRDFPDPMGVRFAAAINDHMLRAQERGKPFPRVWNGGGPKADQYQRDYERMSYAATHPQNAALYNFVRSNLGLPEETALAPSQGPGFASGGAVERTIREPKLI